MKKFTKSDIENYTSDVTYQRGIDLEAKQAVHALKACPVKDKNGSLFLKLTAFVIGNSGVYDVNAYLTGEEGALYQVSCTCPAHRKYSGICKHCTAMLLHYFNNEEYYLNLASKNGFSFNFYSRMETDIGLASLLERFSQSERRQAESGLSGEVSLEPALNLSYNSTTLSLRIGTDKMYIVKNIADLIYNVRFNRDYRYGKNLYFIHNFEAFDEKSRLLLDFVIRQYTRSYRIYSSQERYMELNGGALDELLEITSPDGILVNMLPGNSPYLMHLTDEPLRQKITLNAEENGAYLTFNFVKRIRSNSFNYYLNDNKIYRESRLNRRDAEELDDFLNRNPKTKYFISEKDLPAFACEIFPLLEKYYDFCTDEIDIKQYLPREAAFSIYLDLPQENMITCDLIAIYGSGKDEKVYHVFDGIPETGIRNMKQELKAKSAVMKYCNAIDNTKYLAITGDDEDTIYTLITAGISEFKEWSDVYVSDRLKRISEIRRPQVSVGVAINSGLLDFSISSDNIPLDELAELLSKYDRKKKFIRLKNGTFISTESENLDTLSQLKKGLMLSDEDLANGRTQLPKFRALFLDSELTENGGLQISKDENFSELIRNMSGSLNNDYLPPRALADVLRPYQTEGFRWMETLYANGFGGILADDMGLGKTLQVITFLYAHYESAQPDTELKTLVVCPASLVYNWEDEFTRFAPELPVYTAAGTAAERRGLIASLPEQVIIITSYDLLKRDLENYREIKFEFQILDEAQFIKNSSTKAARSVKMINSVFRMALTGTPVENRLSELWSIFDYIMPGYMFTYKKFRSEIESPIVQDSDAQALGRVQKMISPFVLRRLKKDVLKELPDKIERTMSARMTGEQKKLYNAHVQRLTLFLDKQAPEEFDKSRIQILAELTKLRQLCCDPALLYENYTSGSSKLELCMELAESAVGSGHKVLIFSQFTSMLSRIADELISKDINFYMLTGETSKRERIRMVNAFNSDDVPIFCISLKAGGTGLNLTAADIVIHYDPWWNTAAQNQATDRTHRIGQKNVVTVYKLIAKDSIEEKIVSLQERKQELADQVLGGENIAAPSFSKEELLELLDVR